MPASEPNFDARMVDWLYDELDPAEAKSFEKHLEANPAVLAEAHALKRTREAFREMDQCEPSVGLSSKLMHEAARAVAQSPGLWARLTAFMQPVFLHPAASAMATLVVVAGVAGALYSRNGDMAVQPTAAVSANESAGDEGDPNAAALAPARESASATTVPAKNLAVGGSAGLAQGVTEEQGYRIDLASDGAEGKIKAAEDSLQSERSTSKDDDAPSEFDKKWGGKDSFDLGVIAPEAEMPQRDAPPKGRLNRLPEERGYAAPPPPALAKPAITGKTRTTETKSAKKRQEVPPQPRTRSKSAGPGKGPAQIQDQDKEKPDPLSWADEKTRVLNAAAKDKRCLDAGRIANDILDQKPSYYKQKVEGSKAVSDCGRYVASETNRRAKLRKKQAAAARKKAAGTPTKAKAAPRDETRSEALD